MVLAGLSAAPEPRAESWGPRAAGAGGPQPPSPRRGATGGRQLSRCVGDLSRRPLGAVRRRRPRPNHSWAGGRSATNTASNGTNTRRNRVAGRASDAPDGRPGVGYPTPRRPLGDDSGPLAGQASCATPRARSLHQPLTGRTHRVDAETGRLREEI